jgi:hypothetical protein
MVIRARHAARLAVQGPAVHHGRRVVRVAGQCVHGLFADAFAGGMHLSLLVASIATLLATAAVALFLPRQQPQSTPAAP